MRLGKISSSKRVRNPIELDRKKVLSKVSEIIENQHGIPTVTIITPTTGSKHLKKAVESIQNQNYKDILHLIVVDGEHNWNNVQKTINQLNAPNVKVIILPYNTGKNGMNGHRIYASMPYLINSEYIGFLDEDNWYEANHLETLIELITKFNLDWSYSMRNIFTEDGDFVIGDNCESIGDYKPISNQNKLIDTNCYLIKRNELLKSTQYWYHPLKADRYFFHHLKKNSPSFRSTKKFTVNYRLKNDKPLYPDFFINGNEVMLKKFNHKLPWLV
ncbi:glycosyltransferase family A protein [Dyadobacter tibetensis]|uniref:glycosyltransferase family A protein n=1 Tax=Dyadobacter tibetensis TaxID=1211851 RepID=UPI0018DD65C0|nr:glycosyltransferase family A protein [Dyadobacter tibetensis]